MKTYEVFFKSAPCFKIVFFFTFQFNFVGKLLGPRGNSLKRLQEETGAKMSILGKGSMRDKAKVLYLKSDCNQC